MPIFKNRTAFGIARNITAFLNLDAGLVRGEVPDPESAEARAKRLEAQVQKAEAQTERLRQAERARAEELEQARVRVQKHKRQLEQARRKLEEGDRRITRLERELSADGAVVPASDVDAENIVWVFGTIRTGSTWLGQMMGDLKGHAMWNEPRVGELFGHFFYERASHRKENKNFIMGLQSKSIWLRAIRTLVLDSVAQKYPEVARNGYVIIKEPSGSIGAPLLAEALPESRLVFLIRDPRDVVASALDAAKEGSWTSQLKGSRKRRQVMDEDGAEERPTDETRGKHDGFNRPPDVIVREQANMYLQYVGNSKRAYEAHEGPKVLVRYEELREDTLGTMKRVYSELEVEVDEGELARAVEKHSWDNIPEEEKGEGKFHRKATPGGWREDLTPEQAGTVERITAPLLKEFYAG